MTNVTTHLGTLRTSPEIGVFSGPYYSSFGLNMERMRKIRTRKNSEFGHFPRSLILHISYGILKKKKRKETTFMLDKYCVQKANFLKADLKNHQIVQPCTNNSMASVLAILVKLSVILKSVCGNVLEFLI